MAHGFEQSHAAYERKDGMAAKELSSEAKEHQREMDRLNAEASAWIFHGEYFVPLLCSWTHASPASFVENNLVSMFFVLAR